VGDPPEEVDIPAFCSKVENLIPRRLLSNVEMVYVGQFRELQGHNALFNNGAIYISNLEPTNHDMLEDFVHEVAHSLEHQFAWQIYDEPLINEFKAKRRTLKGILDAQGFKISPLLYDFTEHSQKFDDFLAHEVGYPRLLTLTLGLFSSPYGATSIQEYFANGFEKYFLDSPYTVKKISPVLHQKIEEILNDES